MWGTMSGQDVKCNRGQGENTLLPQTLVHERLQDDFKFDCVIGYFMRVGNNPLFLFSYAYRLK
jgi:hypothetical protein